MTIGAMPIPWLGPVAAEREQELIAHLMASRAIIEDKGSTKALDAALETLDINRRSLLGRLEEIAHDEAVVRRAIKLVVEDTARRAT